MTRFSRRLARMSVGLAALATSGLVPVASAAEEGAAVVVRLEAGPLVDAPLVGSLRELLSRRGALLVVGDAPGPPSRVRVTLLAGADDGAVRVDVVTGSASIERLVPRSSSQAMFRETLAHAIFGAVEPSLSAQGELTPPQAKTSPSSAPVEVASAPSTKRPKSSAASVRGVLSAGAPQAPLDLLVGLQLGPRWLGARAPTFGLGGALAVGFGGRFRPAVGVDVAYVVPIEASAGQVDATLRWVPIRLRGRFEPLSWGWGSLELGVAAGIDRFDVEVTAAPPDVAPSVDSDRLQPILGGGLGARVAFGPLQASITATVDVDLAPRRWVVADGASQLELVELASVRPGLSLAIDWRIGRLDSSARGRL